MIPNNSFRIPLETKNCFRGPLYTKVKLCLKPSAAGIEAVSKTTIFLNHLRASVNPYSLQNIGELNLMGTQIQFF